MEVKLPSTAGARPPKKKMMFFPKVSNCLRLPLRKPSPTPTSSSSEPTPQAIPNMVRKERSLCAHRVRNVWAKMSSSMRMLYLKLPSRGRKINTPTIPGTIQLDWRERKGLSRFLRVAGLGAMWGSESSLLLIPIGRSRTGPGNRQRNSACDQHRANDWRHTFIMFTLYTDAEIPGFNPLSLGPRNRHDQGCDTERNHEHTGK